MHLIPERNRREPCGGEGRQRRREMEPTVRLELTTC